MLLQPPSTYSSTSPLPATVPTTIYLLVHSTEPTLVPGSVSCSLLSIVLGISLGSLDKSFLLPSHYSTTVSVVIVAIGYYVDYDYPVAIIAMCLPSIY